MLLYGVTRVRGPVQAPSLSAGWQPGPKDAFGGQARLVSANRQAELPRAAPFMVVK